MLNDEIVVSIADEERWSEGVDIILESQRVTRLPDPDTWSPEKLAVHTRERQESAMGVWLATVNGESVGHALLRHVPPDHRDWSLVQDRTITNALSRGDLIEMGGLAVLPDWYRRGVAEALVKARVVTSATFATLRLPESH